MKRIKPPKGDAAYHQLWRIVDGAVRQTYAAHPDYFSEKGRRASARSSFVKRVTGSIMGYVEQSTQVRSGARPADAREVGKSLPISGAGAQIPGATFLSRLMWWRR